MGKSVSTVIIRLAITLLVSTVCYCFVMENPDHLLAVSSYTPDDNLWIPNGFVYSSIVDGNFLYIGGNFDYVGPYTGHGVTVDTLIGTVNSSFPEVNGSINTSVSDGSGGWYIGGNFSKVGGVSRSNIAHILFDGSIDTLLNPNPSGEVRTLALLGTDLYVGGDFYYIGGIVRPYIAKINTTTGIVDSTFNLNSNNNVKIIVDAGDYMYVGGYFTSIGGLSRNFVAKVDTTTGAVDPAFNANISAGYMTAVSAATPFGSDLYIGGNFTSVGGLTRNRIAKLDEASGSVDGTFNPNSDGTVNVIIVSGSDLFTAGYFTSIGGLARNGLAKINMTDGTADGIFNPNANSYAIETIALSGSDLYVGGSFTAIGGLPRSRVAKINTTTGTADGTFNPSASSTVYVISVYNSSAFLGGGFHSVGGLFRSKVAKIDITTGIVDETFVPSLIEGGVPWPEVWAMALSDSDLIIGGSFTTIGGLTRNNIAKISSETGATDLTFDPNSNNRVLTILSSGSDIYVGGYFTSIGGLTRNRIAKISASTGAANETFNPNANNGVFSLAMDSSDLYVGGDFTLIGGTSRNYIAKIDQSNGTLDETFNANVNSTVKTTLYSNSNVYIGGNFNSVGGLTRYYLAKINSSTGAVDENFEANTSGSVFTLGILGSNLYVGGLFLSVNEIYQPFLAKVDAINGILDSSLNHISSGDIYTISFSGIDIFAGGILYHDYYSRYTYIVHLLAETTPPVLSAILPTDGSTISDSTPTITFSTNEDASCRISLSDESYPDMSDDITCDGEGSGTHSCTSPDLGPDGTKHLYLACIDEDGNYHDEDFNTDLTYALETTPPVLSAILPTDGSTISDSTPTITFSTNEDASCRISLSDESYPDMSDDITCDGEGSGTHSCPSPDLGPDGTKHLYLACIDEEGNYHDEDSNTDLTYTLDTTPPALSAILPSDGSTVSDSSVIITFSTSESASCRISPSDESYEDMADDFLCDGDGTQNQSCPIGVMSEGRQIQFISCTDEQGNSHQAGHTIPYLLIYEPVIRLPETGAQHVILIVAAASSVLTGAAIHRKRKQFGH
jgi:hypothetical protein